MGQWFCAACDLVSWRQRWRPRGERRTQRSREERREAESREEGEKRKKMAKRNRTKQHNEFFRKSAVEGNKSNTQLLAIKTLESVKSLACALGPLSCRNKGTQDTQLDECTFTHRGTTRAFRLLLNQGHLFCRRHVCEDNARIRRKKKN